MKTILLQLGKLSKLTECQAKNIQSTLSSYTIYHYLIATHFWLMLFPNQTFYLLHLYIYSFHHESTYGCLYRILYYWLKKKTKQKSQQLIKI